MLLQPDCIPCILKMVLSSLRNLTDDGDVGRELITRALRLPALRGENWDLTSPEAIEPVMDTIKEAFQSEDPFAALKEEQNARALALYPSFRKAVQESSDPLFAAVNLAILGNGVDLMVSGRSINVPEVLAEELANPIVAKSYAIFREKLAKARRILYLGDNSGEIVFDKVLIETITEFFDPQITFVVRSVAALNDATLYEAKRVGMDRVATVIPNGIDGSIAGTILSRCSSEVRELFHTADLVISKGGGNFDSLESQTGKCRNITFLLLAKCVPYCNYFKLRMFEPILGNFFH
ncbi:MAG: damage-control phosphatase ARMT1 family protein [Syntrophobacteraceae bacterium]